MSEFIGSDPSLVGRSIEGRYRLEELVNVGALGATYRARHIEHQRVVALKLLHEDVSGDALRRGRFEWEAATLAALAHPNIVAIVDYGVHEGRRWVASEWLEGETLAARIARGPLPLTAAMPIVRQVLAALASAHAVRLLHRNLKPSNVFLERRAPQARERVKLLDFATAPRPAKLGTPAPIIAEDSPYRAPELGAGGALDTRSDVFMVGATLIGMLMGTPALEADPASATAPERARALPGVDATLLAWIRRATAVERSARFADAADMLRELIDLLPRDLRSPPDGSDGSSRAVSMPNSRPAQAPGARPSASPPPLPRSRRPSSVPPPLPSRSNELGAVPAPASAEVVVAPRTMGKPDAADGAEPSASDVAMTIPPPAPVPTEAQAYLRAAAPDESPASSEPGLPVVGLAVRSEGQGSLRPIESLAIPLRSEPRLRKLMAAGVFGAFVVAVLVIFLQPGGHGRARTRDEAAERSRKAVVEPARPAVAARATPPVTPIPESAIARPAAPVVAPSSGAAPATKAAVAPPPMAAAGTTPESAPQAANAPSARPETPAIVAGPGRPPVRDPWLDPIPPELERPRQLALNGAPGDEAKIKALREYIRDHRRDVRAFLIVGQFYCNRLWRTDCVEEWGHALERDPTVRGAPELLPSLLEMVAQGKALPVAQPLILKYYGKEALDSIESAFEDVKSPEAAARLHALRLKISGGTPAESDQRLGIRSQ